MAKPTTPANANRAAAARPRKRFGQHFLADAATIERIVAALRLRPDDHVVEIGPGTGALTERLVAEAATVVAIEIDRDLAAALRRRLPMARTRQADALRVCWGDVLAPARGRGRVVGNLPYNIASPLMALLFEHGSQLRDMHFMLQAEVADRLAANPGAKIYGRLSVLAQHHCRVERLFDAPPACFAPPPKVNSAFVRLTPAPPGAPCDAAALRHVLRLAFNQRRKTLANALRSLPFDAQALGLDPRARPEDLTAGQFAAIANYWAARKNQRGTPA